MSTEYDDLIIGIIKQACDDYRNDANRRQEVEKFFRSAWFKVLTDADGEYILEKLKEEVAENKKDD